MHCRAAFGDGGAVSVYILEIRTVALSRQGPVGYGVDDLGREFEVSLDANLASDLLAALDDGRRPIVAIERGRSVQPLSREPVAVDRVNAEIHPHTATSKLSPA